MKRFAFISFDLVAIVNTWYPDGNAFSTNVHNEYCNVPSYKDIFGVFVLLFQLKMNYLFNSDTLTRIFQNYHFAHDARKIHFETATTHEMSPHQFLHHKTPITINWLKSDLIYSIIGGKTRYNMCKSWTQTCRIWFAVEDLTHRLTSDSLFFFFALNGIIWSEKYYIGLHVLILKSSWADIDSNRLFSSD